MRMTRVYLTAPQQEITARFTNELMDKGVPDDRIHLYSSSPQRHPDLPVAIERYQTPNEAMAYGGVIGTLLGSLVGLPLLGLGTLGIAPLLVVMVAFGIGGAVVRLWMGSGPAGELYRLDDALKRGETVLVLELDDRELEQVEQSVKQRHPELSMMSTDAEEA
jgi:hypothetical protein